MAEKLPPTADDDTLSIPIPLLGGNVIARGATVFIFMAVLGVGWIMWEIQKEHEKINAAYRTQQREEHNEIMQSLEYNSCLNRLAIYIARTPKDVTIDWWAMPQDLVRCAPKFLTEPKTKN